MPAAATRPGSRAARSAAASLSAARVPITAIPVTPAARARSSTPGRSPPYRIGSRWQWLSKKAIVRMPAWGVGDGSPRALARSGLSRRSPARSFAAIRLEGVDVWGECACSRASAARPAAAASSVAAAIRSSSGCCRSRPGHDPRQHVPRSTSCQPVNEMRVGVLGHRPPPAPRGSPPPGRSRSAGRPRGRPGPAGSLRRRGSSRSRIGHDTSPARAASDAEQVRRRRRSGAGMAVDRASQEANDTGELGKAIEAAPEDAEHDHRHGQRRRPVRPRARPARRLAGGPSGSGSKVITLSTRR